MSLASKGEEKDKKQSDKYVISTWERTRKAKSRVG